MRQAQSSGAGGSRSTVGGLQGSFPASPSQPTHTGRARGAISQRHHMATWKFMLLVPGLHGCEGVPGAWGLVRRRPGEARPPVPSQFPWMHRAKLGRQTRGQHAALS